MTDIRSFFAVPQSTPDISKKRPLEDQNDEEDNSALTGAAKGKQRKDKPHQSPPEVKKTTKTARKQECEGKKFLCPPELVQMYDDGKLEKYLHSCHTQELKGLCIECGIPRTGGKYKLIPLVRKHVETASFRKSSGIGGPGASPGQDGEEDIARDTAKQFAKPGLTFAGARSLFVKTIKKSKVALKADARGRLETVLACAKGFDFHIFQAIMGPNSKQYNGSRGETGLEAHADIAVELAVLFLECAPLFDDALFQRFMAFIAVEGEGFRAHGCSRCEPYGFDSYRDHMDLHALAKDEMIAPGLWARLAQSQRTALEALQAPRKLMLGWLSTKRLLEKKLSK